MPRDVMGTDLSVLVGSTGYDSESRDVRVRHASGARVRRRARAAPGETAAHVDPNPTDLALVSGRENLGQAMILRLLTPRGALKALGHGEFGSRLHELVGRLKTDAVRNLCRAFVLEAVAQEPRVERKAVWFEFDLASERVESLAFRLAVRPVDGGDPLELALEVAL